MGVLLSSMRCRVIQDRVGILLRQIMRQCNWAPRWNYASTDHYCQAKLQFRLSMWILGAERVTCLYTLSFCIGARSWTSWFCIEIDRKTSWERGWKRGRKWGGHWSRRVMAQIVISRNLQGQITIRRCSDNAWWSHTPARPPAPPTPVLFFSHFIIISGTALSSFF